MSQRPLWLDEHLGLNKYWLVVWTPLKNISQLGWLFPIYGKIKNGNQTTNQNICLYQECHGLFALPCRMCICLLCESHCSDAIWACDSNEFPSRIGFTVHEGQQEFDDSCRFARACLPLNRRSSSGSECFPQLCFYGIYGQVWISWAFRPSAEFNSLLGWKVMFSEDLLWWKALKWVQWRTQAIQEILWFPIRLCIGGKWRDSNLARSWFVDNMRACDHTSELWQVFPGILRWKTTPLRVGAALERFSPRSAPRSPGGASLKPRRRGSSLRSSPRGGVAVRIPRMSYEYGT